VWNQGRLLILKLLAARLPVRASVRSEASGAFLRAAGAAEVGGGRSPTPIPWLPRITVRPSTW
jgi:hypothetical protein